MYPLFWTPKCDFPDRERWREFLVETHSFFVEKNNKPAPDIDQALEVMAARAPTLGCVRSAEGGPTDHRCQIRQNKDLE